MFLYEIGERKNGKPYLIKVRDLGKEYVEYTIDNIIKILNNILKLNEINVEKFYIIAIQDEKIIGCMLNRSGNRNNTALYNRNIALFLLLSGATDYIVSHNHPNGINYPSEEDKLSTYTLEAMGRLIGIELNAHIIIAKDNHCFVEF